MNCSEASSLFSARVDNELDSEIAFRLEDHLDRCVGCQSQWTSFYATIRMVQGLPREETHPAFVGQVLDRVRAYEAEGGPFLEPVDRPFAEAQPVVRRVSWFEVARERVQNWVQPVPALAVGSLALGVGLGVFAFQQDDSSAGGASVAGVPTAAVTVSTVLGGGSPLVLDLPFADIADRIRVSEPEEPFADAPGTWIEPHLGLRGPQQQVRLGNDAPRITF